MATKSGQLSGSTKPAKDKEHSIKIRKLHDGFHVEKKHPDGSTTEHSAADMDEVGQHLEDHFGAYQAPETPEDEGSTSLPGQGPSPTVAT